ncbi:hypothetical protein BH10PSE19_BH10PSE19_10410 [soil metagenome]
MPGLIDAHVHVVAPELSLTTDTIPYSYSSIQAGTLQLSMRYPASMDLALASEH